jgi:hypothetical protein
MDAIDWKAPARLRRADGESAIHEGRAGELVRHVALLSAEHRTSVVLEVDGGRIFELDEILELAAREDLGD